ncbi:MAG: hypothetical protein M0Z46_10825 [Actinomycetota bacterium]|nr:hypothetical protein [Actinomycetota bacterium]
MGKRAVDLFDDPAWKARVEAARPARPSEASLICTLILVLLFMASMALPWFQSGETPPWTPFSRWLNLGWSPGTQKWGLLLVALGAALAVATGLTIRTRRKVLFGFLPACATALVVTTLLETSAHLSVNPGPPLQPDFGARFGDGLAVLVLITATVATLFGIPQRFRQPS